MKRILFCKGKVKVMVKTKMKARACGRPLSHAVTIMNGLPAGVVPTNLAPEESPVPKGTAFISHEPYLNGPGPEVWMNLDDLLGDVGYTSEMGPLSGCCGPSGYNGPNRICSCGAHIGTEISDCITPRMFVPDTTTTEWRDEEEEP